MARYDYALIRTRKRRRPPPGRRPPKKGTKAPTTQGAGPQTTRPERGKKAAIETKSGLTPLKLESTGFKSSPLRNGDLTAPKPGIPDPAPSALSDASNKWPRNVRSPPKRRHYARAFGQYEGAHNGGPRLGQAVGGTGRWGFRHAWRR